MTVTVGSEIDLLSRLYIGHNVPLDVLSRWLGDVEEEVELVEVASRFA